MTAAPHLQRGPTFRVHFELERGGDIFPTVFARWKIPPAQTRGRRASIPSLIPAWPGRLIAAWLVNFPRAELGTHSICY